MMIAVISFFLLAQLAFGAQVYDLNQFIDYQLEAQRDYLTKQGQGIFALPPASFTGLDVDNGHLIGLNSFIRTGNASMKVSDDLTTRDFQAQLAFRLLDLAFGSIRINGDQMTGMFRVKQNSFRVNISAVRDGESCNITIREFGFVNINDVILDSSLPQYDGKDFTKTFLEFVVPSVNERLVSWVQANMDEVKPYFCFYS